jgi:hypothetical protein
VSWRLFRAVSKPLADFAGQAGFEPAIVASDTWHTDKAQLLAPRDFNIAFRRERLLAGYL